MSTETVVSRALNSLQAFVKTDVNYLLKGGFWLTFGQVVASLSAFFISVAYANLLNQHDYGIYKYIIAVAGILAAASFPGINASITRSAARGLGGSFLSATWWRIFGGFVGSAISLMISAYYYIQGNETLALGILAVAALLPFYDAFTTAGAYIQGKRDFKSDAWYGVFVRIGSALVIIGSLYFTRDIVALILIHFISYTTLRGIVYWHVYTQMIHEPADAETVPYGRHLTYMNVLHLAALQIDKVLLFQFIGSAELAIYSIAIAIPDHIRGFVRNAEYLAAPKFAQLDHKNVRQTLDELWRKMILFALLIGIGVCVYYFFAPVFFSILFPQYSESVAFSQLYAITIILSIMILPTSLLRYQARTKELYIANIISDVSQIAFLFVLIWMFGIWGAVWARIFGLLTSGIVSIVLVRYAYRRSN